MLGNRLHNMIGRLWHDASMTETVACSVRNPALKRAQDDVGMVVSVFMVETIGQDSNANVHSLNKLLCVLRYGGSMTATIARETGTHCPGIGTNCRAVGWHSSYGSEDYREPGAVYCSGCNKWYWATGYNEEWPCTSSGEYGRWGRVCGVSHTPNDAGVSATIRGMNGASVMGFNLPGNGPEIMRVTHNLMGRDLVREWGVWGMTLTPLADASPGGKRNVPGEESGAFPETKALRSWQ